MSTPDFQVAREMASLLNGDGATYVRLRQAVVSSVEDGSVTIFLAGDQTPISNIKHLDNYQPEVGHVIWALENGPDLLALGHQFPVGGLYRWTPPDVPINVSYFINGTFDPANYPLALWIKVQVQAGGGGGGGAPATAAGQVSSGSGGGGGGYAESIIEMADIAAPVAVTVGAAGAGGVGANNGGAGGNSSFGALVVAGGGSGGPQSMTNTAIAFIDDDVLGGTATVGDILVPGDKGLGRFSNQPHLRSKGGLGGGSRFGTGGRGFNSSTTGAVGGAANGYGAGGGGACNSASQAARTGGPGTAGIVVVEVHFDRNT
jgi:hypothetical protein